MSAESHHERTAFATQLLSLLENYEYRLQLLVDNWPDEQLLEDVNDLARQMQAQATAAPFVEAAWAAASRSHDQLIDRLRAQGEADPARFDWLEGHLARVLEFEGACLLLLTGRQLAA